MLWSADVSQVVTSCGLVTPFHIQVVMWFFVNIKNIDYSIFNKKPCEIPFKGVNQIIHFSTSLLLLAAVALC